MPYELHNTVTLFMLSGDSFVLKPNPDARANDFVHQFYYFKNILIAIVWMAVPVGESLPYQLFNIGHVTDFRPTETASNGLGTT